MGDTQLTVLHAKPGAVSASLFIDTTTVNQAAASSKEEGEGFALYMPGTSSPLLMIDRVVKALNSLVAGKYRHRYLRLQNRSLLKFSPKALQLSPINITLDSLDSPRRVAEVFRSLVSKQSECIVQTWGEVDELERLMAQLRGSNESAGRAQERGADTDLGLLTAADRTRAKVDEFLSRKWPTSADIGQRLSNSTTNPGQYAADARARRQLLGAWDSKRRTFVHPDFQFDEFGRIDPRVEKLINAFETHPDLSQDRDKGGWRRVFWLYSTRPELGEEQKMSKDGDRDGIDTTLSSTGVSPVEKFLVDAEAVIRLVQRDVERLKDDW
ncbi:hypothetical protein [Tahibacter sp.]|uniref:hypothetical protein n=1 Tax=Tahibacter sp. TaxID=2056211 RepID=UPI0028C4A8EE|nr:hypothetical protein [Tahibacter sp.]